ncbi:arsenate reductase [Litorimonas taeanensis]|uniref:Arsenate reductase n=1 Tax=Litorimonas taeanensis TaxID=568099 RepID=A0A420WKQ6_9PROT|nr:arsenate reductase family protein [Litorimonas taeanensis]RKQ71598.1 arsenate reductase [Litorimonas taeanensis]
MIVVHHNPNCGTSRNVVAILRAAGYEPEIIDYITEGWTRPQLLGLLAAANLTPREALRTTKSPAKELGLLEDSVSEDEIFKQMLEHPVLVNRPLVCSPNGVKLCRPSEAVLNMIDNHPPENFRKEDGEPLNLTK